MGGIDAFRPHVLWLDAGSEPGDPAWIRSLAGRPATGLLLTGGAVAIPARLGLEQDPPSAVDRPWRDADDELLLHASFSETPRIRGHAAFRRHRLFEGLGSGVYTWWPRDGEPCRAWTYRKPAWPTTGRVIAVERAFIHINPDRATIWEYFGSDRNPHVLCIGAYLPLESRDPAFRPHVQRLANNALRYLAGALRSDLPDLHWEPPQPHCVRDAGIAAHAGTNTPLPTATAPPGPLPLGIAPLRLQGSGDDAPFTVAGRRTLVAGREDAGIREIWTHPVRLLQDLRIAEARCETATVTALGIERTLRLAGVPVSERVCVPAELPAAILEYERARAEGADHAPVTLRLEWTTDLRLMWPYPPDATGPLHWTAQDGSLVVGSARTGETACFRASATAPGTECGGPHEVQGLTPVTLSARDASSDRARLECSLTARLRPGERLQLVLAASVAERDDLAATLRALGDPPALVRARAATLARLQRERLRVEAPDPRIAPAIEWAKARLDSYLVETPGVGRSLVAGYGPSRPGWNDGRPGYAWYFGRDAAWTALASLATGEFDAPREVIAFLGANQDLTGKILHECTTSGVVHYDAADSTPLYLLLVARYLAWTGNDGFVRSQWEHVRRALEFCFATDHDGDGLIENTRVGHGWIEFGRLGGGKVTYYNAGIWTAALRELAVAAESIGEARLAAELESRAKAARLALESVFFDPAARRYALKASDGPDGWTRDFTPTATHAVPLLLGVADAGRAGSWLDLVASPAFTTDWGVRLIPDTEPDFDPGRYHGGAVWPLYTGWTAWAEYAAGRSASAFRHWRSILDLAFERAKGAWDEVLDGAERRAAGVCPDQAWSTAMAVSPLVYGLLGAEPDAAKGRLRLRPQIPDTWDRLDVRNLRMGDASMGLRYARHGSSHTFSLEQEEGAVPIRLIFEPAVPAGRIAAIRVDGEPANLDPRAFGRRTIAPVQLVLDHERAVELELAPREAPGEPGS